MLKKKRRVKYNILSVLIYICAGISVALLAGIIIYVFARGIKSVTPQFLTTVT